MLIIWFAYDWGIFCAQKCPQAQGEFWPMAWKRLAITLIESTPPSRGRFVPSKLVTEKARLLSSMSLTLMSLGSIYVVLAQINIGGFFCYMNRIWKKYLKAAIKQWLLSKLIIWDVVPCHLLFFTSVQKKICVALFFGRLIHISNILSL